MKLAVGIFVVAVLLAAGYVHAQVPNVGTGSQVQVTASATGTTGAITATLAGAPGKNTYICGFNYAGTNATGANTATLVTITGVAGGPLNFPYPTLAAAATVPPIRIVFSPYRIASAANTSIVVNGPALGTGATLAAAAAWGYQR